MATSVPATISLRINSIRKGLHNEAYGLVWEDRATGWLDCRGLPTKTAAHAAQALVHWRGPKDQLRYLYTDGSKELRACLAQLQVPHDHCIPGNKRNNSRGERAVRTVVEGTRTILLAAGMPTAFWPYAAQYYCAVHNSKQWRSSKPSAWYLRHGVECERPLYPFGVLVDARPSEVSPHRPAKMAPKGVPCILLGYAPQTGGGVAWAPLHT